ncbi:hypothetical protein QJS10_CPB18g00521 [Acorus calamus]|uniref:Reverse transcriptase zinc-binding domain-containing protein n=1 Tax=Acorus calamus TaxID=4465 RepID=A0AAV9CLU4_ACOCL|nr:hypothetical protein QJS10_CPB18g00521 [Acorus calamus]
MGTKPFRGLLSEEGLHVVVVRQAFRPTNGSLHFEAYRAKWRPSDPTECTFCQAEPETVEHLLLRCPFGARMWRELGKATGLRFQCQTMPEIRDALSSAGTSTHALPA